MSVTPLGLKRNFLGFATKSALAAVVGCGVAVSSGLLTAQTAGGSVLYRLNTDSSFEQGCFAPCLCPVMIDEPVKGTFLLTPSGFDGSFSNYAVTAVNWKFTNNGSLTSVTGSGAYKVGGQAASQQQLSLYLQMDGGQVEHFDSGLVPDVAPFPNIQVTISTNGQYCFDTVFSVNASPTPVPQLEIGVTSANNVVLSRAASSDSFNLQESSDLTRTDWATVTNIPTVVGQQNQIVLPLSSGNHCYRLWPGGN